MACLSSHDSVQSALELNQNAKSKLISGTQVHYRDVVRKTLLYPVSILLDLYMKKLMKLTFLLKGVLIKEP